MGQHVNDFTESLQSYYCNLRRYKTLTREEECKLFKEYKAGSEVAKNKIIKANLKFAFSIAKKYSGRGVAMEDLVSEANLGLMHAMEKYDFQLGNKFISYAVWWIKRYIMDAIKKESSIMKDDDILDADMDNGRCDSLVDPEDEKVTYGETFSDGVADELEEDDSKAFTVVLMKVLDDKEKLVISKLYGMGNTKESPLRELSKEMGVSIERVRQIKQSAIDKMRISALSDAERYEKFFQ